MIPSEVINEHLKTDDEGEPVGLTVTAEEMARIWTARRFRVSQQRISNLLTVGGARKGKRTRK